MGRPAVTADNLFNTTIYPQHVIAADSETEGFEAFRVGTGRRLGARNRWEPTGATPSGGHYVGVTCNRRRFANYLVLDRGTNQLGRRIIYEVRMDVGAGWTTLVDTIIPTVVQSNSNIYRLPGVLTPEGAWIYSWAEDLPFFAGGIEYRLRFPEAMTTKPQVVGAYSGELWRMDYQLSLPYEDSNLTSIFDETVSSTAWSSATRAAARRSGTMNYRLSGYEEEELARFQNELFQRRKPTWLIFDSAQAERAVMIENPQGETGPSQRPGWGFRQLSWRWHEREPRLTL